VDNEISKNHKNLWIKILIPILILTVVVGIYVYKNVQEEKLNNQNAAYDADEENLPLAISSVYLDEIKSYGLPFVIDFGSDSCIPCKQMAPVLETLHGAWQGKAIVHFVDVWKNTTAANDFPISLIPTQIFYNSDGSPFVPSDELSKEIIFTMYSSKDTNDHLFTVHEGGITEEEMRKIFAEMGVE